MRLVTYSLTMSLDGYVMDEEGRFDWGVPDPEVFALATDEVRGVGVHLLGRHLYETMLYWEDPEVLAGLDEAEERFATLWNALPKVVFSSTLTRVEAPARLASDSLADEIARLRAEPGEGDIAIGGAALAAAAADLDLVDEYRVRVCPVLLGGGTPFFAHHGRRVQLELVESRVVGPEVVYLRHRVVRTP